MYAPWNTRQQERRNVNEQVLHNLRRIHGNGKEKAHKEMSELLEKILSNDNMNAAYKRVCANKGAGGVDDVTVEQNSPYSILRRSRTKPASKSNKTTPPAMITAVRVRAALSSFSIRKSSSEAFRAFSSASL